VLDRPPRSIPKDGALFVVETGETLSTISRRLESEGLIRSALLLRALARVEGTDESIKAGFYRVRPGTDLLALHRLLVEGRQDQVSVTFPEGWTAGRMGAYLEEKKVTTRAAFLDAVRSPELLERFKVPGGTLEGYLYPDTYFLSQNMPAELIVAELVQNFFRRLEAVAPEYAALKPSELHDRVIMASIVEREYRVEAEAPYIASVFYNRMKYGLGLESCATVAYIISEIQGKPYPQSITKEDLAIDSPFNTYKWAGYPPAPISDPGAVALDAAFHPATTEYYYFVLRDPEAGSHYFSKDLEEHNEAKQFFLKGINAGG